MSYPAQIVYVDLQSSRVFANSTGQSLSWPTFLAGGVQNIGVRFLTGDGSGGYIIDNTYASRCASIRCGLGIIDYVPEGGQYRISIQEGTTSLLPFSAGVKQVQDALNSLVNSNPFICERDATGIYIARSNGADFTISSSENTIIPQSFIAFRGQTINGNVRYKMTFEVAPLAFTSGGDQMLPPKPVATTLQHGGSDGFAVWNTIQNLYIPPTFQGTFQLADGYYKSDLLDITDGAPQIQAALNKMLAPKGKGYTVTVTNPTSFNVHITFDGFSDSGGFAGSDVPPLNVSVYSAPPADWTFLLNLDTIPLHEFLRGKGQKSLQFEAEADFYVSNPMQGQPLPATFRKKLWSMPVMVAESLIKPQFQTAQAIAWLEPPTGKTYLPFSPNQTITGQQSYTTVLGDGSATTFLIPHNLGTDNLASVLVRENSSPGRILKPSEYQLVEVNESALSLEFSSAPAANSIAVAITAAGPTTVFNIHSHTIADVELLEDRLFTLSTRLAYIETLIPQAPTIVSVTTTMPDQKNILPPFGELLPDLSLENTNVSIASQIMSAAPPKGGGATPPPVVIPGTDLQEQNQKAAAELAKIQAQIEAAKQAAIDAAEAAKEAALKTATVSAKQDSTLLTTLSIPFIGTNTEPKIWPFSRAGAKAPRLPRAIQGTPSNTSSLPTAAGVYRAMAPITLPASLGRKAMVVPVNGVFASDGVIRYRAAQWKSGGWYATDMDRELYRTLISESSFPEGASLSASLETNTSLITSAFESSGVSYGCEYILQVLAVPLTAQDPGVGAASTPAVIMETPLSFSMASEKRQFSIKMKRDGSKSSCMVYGASVEGDPVPQGDFTLAVRLTAFDIDDSSQDPSGRISLWMPATQITITR